MRPPGSTLPHASSALEEQGGYRAGALRTAAPGCSGFEGAEALSEDGRPVTAVPGREGAAGRPARGPGCFGDPEGAERRLAAVYPLTRARLSAPHGARRGESGFKLKEGRCRVDVRRTAFPIFWRRGSAVLPIPALPAALAGLWAAARERSGWRRSGPSRAVILRWPNPVPNPGHGTQILTNAISSRVQAVPMGFCSVLQAEGCNCSSLRCSECSFVWGGFVLLVNSACQTNTPPNSR